MRKLLPAMACAAGIAAATGASAADIVLPAPIVAVAPVAVAEPGFNWSRFYVGIIGGAFFNTGPFSYYAPRIAAVIGRNFAVGDRLVFGLEVTAGGYWAGAPYFVEVYGQVRSGFLLTENLLLYGTLGYGRDPNSTPPPYIVFGGGAELALGDRLSLRSDALFYRSIGTPVTYFSLTGGISLYLGR